MDLKELENEYNISLSEQDKLYMIVNKYTLVVHNDGTYTLIKGNKINKSCSGFKHLGVHSTEGKKIVDLNDYSLKGVNLLGNVYSNVGCGNNSFKITQDPGEFIFHATSKDGNPGLNVDNTTIPYITTVLEKNSIKQLLNMPGGSSMNYLWPGVQNNHSNCGVLTVIQSVLWQNLSVVNSSLKYPNYAWIYDSTADGVEMSKVWSSKNVSDYSKLDFEPPGGMNLHIINDGSWTKYNSITDKKNYLKNYSGPTSWYVNSMLIAYKDKYYVDGTTAQFYIFSRDIIKIPLTCDKIIFKMYRNTTHIEILATVIDSHASGPPPSTKLTVRKYYNPDKTGGLSKFNITPFNNRAINCFSTIYPITIETTRPLTLYNNLKVTLSVSNSSLTVRNYDSNNTICKIKYICDLTNMPLLISNINKYPNSQLDLTSNNIIKPYYVYSDKIYNYTAYESMKDAVNDFNNSGCYKYYNQLNGNPKWTWNDMSHIKGWGWPYQCNNVGDCSEVRNISWKDYHYVDLSSCKNGIYWSETIYNTKNNTGNVQLQRKWCSLPPSAPISSISK